MVVTELG